MKLYLFKFVLSLLATTPDTVLGKTRLLKKFKSGKKEKSSELPPTVPVAPPVASPVASPVVASTVWVGSSGAALTDQLFVGSLVGSSGAAPTVGGQPAPVSAPVGGQPAPVSAPVGTKSGKKDKKRRLGLAAWLSETDQKRKESVAVSLDKPNLPMKSNLDFVGFIRIPKTGSTTMTKFLHKSPSLFRWLSYLSVMPDRSILGPVSCIFGHPLSTAHVGSNYDIDFYQTDSWFNCPHVAYPQLVKKWSESLDLWTPPAAAVLDEDAMAGNFNFSLQAFTVVREPFDRLVSLFYYMRNENENIMRGSQNRKGFLLDNLTDAQYHRLKENDFNGWMELLYEECVLGRDCGILAFQFEFMDRDLGTALDLISGDGRDNGPPDVIAVVNECYEVSLHLLSETIDGITSEDVDVFINSNHFHSNSNKKAYADTDFESLRVKAREWFQDEYAFYDAATRQFQKYISVSKMDHALLEGCVFWDEGMTMK